MRNFYVDIEQVCFKLGLELKAKGDRLVGLCPFHTEADASFTIYTKTNSFYCYGCHVGGNTLKLVSSFVEEVKTMQDLVRWLGNALPMRVPVVRSLPVSRLRSLLDGKAVRIPVTTASRNPLFLPFGIGYVENGALVGRHIIPIYFGDRLVAYEARDFTGRRLPKTVIQPPEVAIHSYLWNFDAIPQEASIIVVEGIKGAIALLSYGETNVVSSFGAQLSSDQVALLITKRPTEVVISYDADNAGALGASEAITQLLAWTTVSTVSLPTGCDPWDIAQETWQECYRDRTVITTADKNINALQSLKTYFV